MSCGEFTDNEIRHELALLGYHNVPQEKLEDFKKDLMKLITQERSKSVSLNSSGVTDCEGEEDFQKADKGFDEDESFNNHGSQWIDQPTYKEDWHYKGIRPISSPPEVSPPQHAVRTRHEYYNDYVQPSSSSISQQERNQSCMFRDDMSETSTESRCMKRKTSRRAPDGCRMVDESFSDTNAGVFEIYERIRNLAMRECECGAKCRTDDMEPPYRIHGKNKNPSVIRKKEPPHTRNLIRTNINERHKMYKEVWKAQPPIGDDRRLKLRKAVHAKMMQHQDIKMKQKIYVPNSYVPPHEKLRKDVRWKVKQAFENYELPETGFYHDI